MKNIFVVLLIFISMNCANQDGMSSPSASTPNGYTLLTKLAGHWVGSNETVFGNFDWFAFDFRPISASHVHSIYEGASNQNIITSVFIADFEGEKQIMARNGGWLGGQYRATYFVLDQAEERTTSSQYRLVDAVGGKDRAYMTFHFENDTLYFDAYKDNSGSLDAPIHHMGFKGTNYNASFAQTATDFFGFPQNVAEVDLENKFTNLIDPDSALFLEENADPFPKSAHGYLSDLKINIEKDNTITNQGLLLYISTMPLINSNGQIDFDALNTKIVRTVTVQSNEAFYETTYLHPDTYFVTAFTDDDNNYYPSSGEISSESIEIEVMPEQQVEMDIAVDMEIQ